ncbi:MAG: hypothetical protein ACOWYE_11545 [Desulfatiglandales bacterium]
MQNEIVSHSLIPYLDNAARIHLKISLRPFDAEASRTSHTPFLSLSDSGPLSRIFEAQCLTDAASRVQRLFLLVQRDRYQLKSNLLWSLNNRDVDTFWEKAFVFYSSVKEQSRVILFSEQIGQDNTPVPWRSLFYCKHKERFFHPPCPACGAPLEQCYRDDVLRASGLQPYSSTLRRYLYCPDCYVSGRPADFYACELEERDPPTLRDRWDLVRGFRRLLGNRPEVDSWPCFGCPDSEACHQPDGPALSRITPFSFYPFHMLILRAMSLHALDFLALVSGAHPDEVESELESRQETGRAVCLRAVKPQIQAGSPFFFDRDDKGFLEILYLKLCFLAQVFESYPLMPDFQRHPALVWSLDHFWIHLEATAGLLPSYWHFTACPVDIAAASLEESPPPGTPVSHGLYALGLMGFQTLVTNRRYGAGELHRHLSGLLKVVQSAGASSETPSFPESLDGLLSPENIFWDPEGKRVTQGVCSPWREALGLCWSVLRAGFHQESDWSRASFLTKLTDLARSVKRRLFEEDAVSDEQVEARAIENEAIRGILTKILERWRVRPETTAAEAAMDAAQERAPVSFAEVSPGGEAVSPQDTEQPLEKTTIVSLNALESRASEDFPGKGHGEDLPGETEEKTPQEPLAGDSPGPETGPEPLEETTIISLEELERKSREKDDEG